MKEKMKKLLKIIRKVSFYVTIYVYIENKLAERDRWVNYFDI